MPQRIVRMVRDLAQLLARFPRRHVLRQTGEPVELLEVHDFDGQRRCVVELRGGRRIEVAESELSSQLALNAVTVAGCAAVALAGVAAGGALGLAKTEELLADMAACAYQALPPQGSDLLP